MLRSVDGYLKKARHILDVLWRATFIVYGTRVVVATLRDDLFMTFLKILDSVFSDTWDRELKFHTNSWFCKKMGQEKPALIGSIHKAGTLFLGALGRKISKLSQKHDSRFWMYANTILQGVKRGMPKLGLAQVEKSAEGHRKRLTKVGETPEWLLDEVRRTSTEIWGGKVKAGIPDDFCSISRKACLENPRSGEGAMGYLKDLRWGEGNESVCSDRFLIQARYTPKLGVRWFYTDFLLKEAILDARMEQEDGDYKEGLFGPRQSEVKFILEPLKVRTITKSSLYNNALFPEIQKQLWGGLQRFPQFRLTGEKMTTAHLESIDSEVHDCVPDPEVYSQWCSGDYSAATDNLHMDCTEAALFSASGDLNLTSSLMQYNLCSQAISYRNSFKGIREPEDFVQTNGQLMGSIFSFPFLCCINLAVYRAAWEKHTGKIFKIHQLPVRVNGDDILFRTNAEFQARWEGLISQVGFEKSVGKNFVSEKFCTVNSMLFRDGTLRKGDQHVHKYTFVPFINTSFLTGVKKGEDTSDDRDQTRNDKLHCLRGAFRDMNLEWMKKDIVERFRAAVLSRLDVRDSKMSRFDLGIDTDLSGDRDQVLRYWFHNVYLRSKDSAPLTDRPGAINYFDFGEVYLICTGMVLWN